MEFPALIISALHLISASCFTWCSDSICRSDAPFLSERSTLFQRYNQHCGWHSLFSVCFVSKHANATQCRPCATIWTDCIRMHESKLFTNLYAYDQRQTHARNVNSSCSSLMMRREIVAAKRAGVTTSVIMEIAPRGNRAQRCASHDCSCTITMEYEMESEFSSDKKIRAQGQTLESLRSN